MDTKGSRSDVLTIHIDGAARGNPGPAACAYVIQPKHGPAIEAAFRLGHATNNVAEYTALVRALEKAAQLSGRRLDIYSDSELMVKQMNGQYKVKNPDLQVLYAQAKKLAGGFDAVKLTHVRRAQNARADQLCNDALDGKPIGETPDSSSESSAEDIDELAIACLRDAAQSWARGDAHKPRPEAVWQQLRALLAGRGLE